MKRASRLATLTRAELSKFVHTRSTQWISSVAIIIGLLIAVSMVVVSVPETRTVDPAASIMAISLFVSMASPLLGAILMTSDWQTREMASLLLLEPRRGLVFLSKIVAAAILACGLATVIIMSSVLVSLAASLVTQLDIVYSGTIGDLVAALVDCVVLTMIGAAIGSVARITALAITLVICQSLIVEPALSLLPGTFGDFLAAASISEMFAFNGDVFPALTAGALWIVLPFAVGWSILRNAEV